MALFCFDCNCWRNKFGMEIKKAGKVVGFACYKCSKKREVAGHPSERGKGWRERFRDFLFNLQNNKGIVK